MSHNVIHTVAVPADSSLAYAVTLIEHPDIVRPQLLDVELDYGVGHIVIRASETIDATPSSFVSIYEFFVSRGNEMT